MMRMVGLGAAVMAGVLMVATPGFAAGGGGGGGGVPSGEPESGRASIRAAEKLIKQKKYEEALVMLDELRQKDEQNPDIYNYMGFCLRKLDRLEDSAAFYNAALSVKADHIGALEYQGELYLMQNNLAGAEANLAKLAQLCLRGIRGAQPVDRRLQGKQQLAPVPAAMNGG